MTSAKKRVSSAVWKRVSFSFFSVRTTDTSSCSIFQKTSPFFYGQCPMYSAKNKWTNRESGEWQCYMPYWKLEKVVGVGTEGRKFFLLSEDFCKLFASRASFAYLLILSIHVLAICVLCTLPSGTIICSNFLPTHAKNRACSTYIPTVELIPAWEHPFPVFIVELSPEYQSGNASFRF